MFQRLQPMSLHGLLSLMESIDWIFTPLEKSGRSQGVRRKRLPGRLLRRLQPRGLPMHLAAQVKALALRQQTIMDMSQGTSATPAPGPGFGASMPAKLLLYLHDQSVHPDGLVKIFGAMEDRHVHRQIGDRRGQNARKATVIGPSRNLSNGCDFTDLYNN